MPSAHTCSCTPGVPSACQCVERRSRQPAPSAAVCRTGTGAMAVNLAAALTLGLPGLPVAAQSVVTDGSLGGPAVTLPGPAYEISQELGTIRGQNLFHSFARFGIAPGEAARFTTAQAFSNVIARVTGGEPSTLSGPLQLQALPGSAPDFYFINPAGVLFGAGASINVPAAFHLSTADQLHFADGSMLAVAAGAQSTLSAAAPEAFGFLENHAAQITVDGGQLFNPAASLSVSAGNVEVSNGGFLGSGTGSVHVAATGSNAVRIGAGAPAGVALGGTVVARDGGIILSAPGVLPAQGQLSIDAGRLVIINTGIESATAGSTPALPLVLRIRDDTVMGPNAQLVSGTFADGAAGDIDLETGRLLLDGGEGSAQLRSANFAGTTGASGSIRIVADAVEVRNNAEIATITAGDGAAGALHIRAGTLSVDGGTTGFSRLSSDSSGNGQAGDVMLDVDGALTLYNGALVSSSALAGGSGGRVSVRAGTLDINGGARGVAGVAALAVSGGQGNGGAVDITVNGAMQLDNGGAVSSNTASPGRGGLVRVQADSLTLSSSDAFFSTINSDSLGPDGGAAGRLDISVAGALTLASGTNISSSTSSSGAAGDVRVAAGSVTITASTDADSGVFSNVYLGGSGAGGNVEVVAAENISILDNGAISSSTLGSGDAGQVRVIARELTIDGRNTGLAGILSASNGVGNAGRLEIVAADRLVLANGGLINSDSDGLGNGGEVTVDAGNLRIDAGPISAGITSNTYAAEGGNAGSVTVRVAGTLEMTGDTLDQRALILSSTGGSGRAGAVRIDAGNLRLDANSAIAAFAGPGSGGRTGIVDVRAGDRLHLDGGLLSIENLGQATGDAADPVSVLRVSAPRLSLNNTAQISAAASGGNPASPIELTFDQLIVDRASISTEADGASGGPIRLTGRLIALRTGAVTTSVSGARGDGGDIRVNAGTLLLDGGFVQANTEAANARGGLIVLQVDEVLASEDQLIVGGDQAVDILASLRSRQINVVQAAAPDGVSGEVRISAPPNDLAGSLGALPAAALNLGGFVRDPCERRGANRFAVVGRQGPQGCPSPASTSSQP